ncbi:MAG: hypothetical protein Ct9H300mP14_13250 [Gammaproteobacteria bacterium]|nr:MAG: hypothetical protein Ct9H300mP14_13250 [Gammaproteobacteria bacterium]
MSQSRQTVRVHSPHPLDPLSSEELSLAVGSSGTSTTHSRALFEQVRLREPKKIACSPVLAGNHIEREAFAVVLDRNADKVTKQSFV